MDLGMQVSLTETFNIVAADFVMNNVALVGSAEIPWLPKSFAANPSSVIDIVTKMKEAVFYQSKLQDSLMDYNKSSENIWRRFITCH